MLECSASALVGSCRRNPLPISLQRLGPAVRLYRRCMTTGGSAQPQYSQDGKWYWNGSSWELAAPFPPPPKAQPRVSLDKATRPLASSEVLPDPPAPQPAPRHMSDRDRQDRLQQAMNSLAGTGRQITPLGPFQFQVVNPGSQVNHILHLLITLFTCGLWVIVWILLAVSQGEERRQLVFVDSFGSVWISGAMWWPAPGMP